MVDLTIVWTDQSFISPLMTAVHRKVDRAGGHGWRRLTRPQPVRPRVSRLPSVRDKLKKVLDILDCGMTANSLKDLKFAPEQAVQ
jgi:hypothetical protein